VRALGNVVALTSPGFASDPPRLRRGDRSPSPSIFETFVPL
jgi:hypothetical protein